MCHDVSPQALTRPRDRGNLTAEPERQPREQARSLIEQASQGSRVTKPAAETGTEAAHSEEPPAAATEADKEDPAAPEAAAQETPAAGAAAPPAAAGQEAAPAPAKSRKLKLNEQMVHEIRAAYDGTPASAKNLATLYNVSRETVRLVALRKRWRDVPPIEGEWKP